MQKKNNIALIAVGGNSLLSDKVAPSIEEQYRQICETASHIADIIELGFQVCITHGNGPQVGFMLLRSELATKYGSLHPEPLVACVADTQGSLGWHIQQALANELKKRKKSSKVACVITQVEVSEEDSGFSNPEKFIGGFFQEEEVEDIKKANPSWVLKEDSGRGWRRVVPSPKPVDIVELDAIKSLLASKYNVIAAGGGGVPVVAHKSGELLGVDAVIDKDLVSSLLAYELGAEVFIISTGVEKICVNYKSPEEKEIGEISAEDLAKSYDAGQFPPGSMGPKVEAALDFIKKGGKRVIITSPENLKKAFLGKAGTHVVP